MRPARRKLSRQRTRAQPARSRLTVPKAVAALQRGREALGDIQGQLDALLAQLGAPALAIDRAAPERLAGAARNAGRAFAALDDLKRLLP